MRTVFIILAVLSVTLSVIFVVFPMGSLALLPIGLALVFSFLAYYRAGKLKNKFPKILLTLSVILLLTAVGKLIFIKEKVEVDQNFQQEQINSQHEAIGELEDIENLDSLTADLGQDSL